MKALVFVGYFEEVLEASREYKEHYIRILITDRKVSDVVSANAIDETIIVDDFTNKDIMETTMEKLMEKYEIEFLYANIEWAVEICGYLRDKYNIEGLSENICIKTRDKYIMKQELKKNGILTAQVEKVLNKKHIIHFAKQNGYPLVIKPRKGAATKNTFLIKTESDIEKILNKINIVVDEYIVESFIEGEEYHCDTVVVDGKVIFSAVSKYYTNLIETINTDFPISAIIYPKSCNGESVVKKIKKMNEKVINILGIDTSICHLEVFIDNHGQCIFGEIASRIGGGPLIGNAIRCAYGVDLYKIFVELGIKKEISCNIIRDNYAGYIALPTKSGEVVKISSEEDYINDIDIKMVKIMNKPGDIVVEKDNTAKRTGYFIVEGDCYTSLKQRMICLYNDFVLEIKEKERNIFNIFG